jgi:hypothetical protein
MSVEVNQMTGRPVLDEDISRSETVAEQLAACSSDALQLTAQALGFEKSKYVVSELLFGLLPEEAVAVAMEGLQREYGHFMAARNVVREGEPFL